MIGEAWTRVALRKVATLGTGHTPSRQHPEYWEDCTIPWLTLADVGPLRTGTKQFVTDTSERISELGVRNSSAVVHPEGTVVMSRTASVGYSAILGVPMATSQDYVTWDCGPRLEPRFLLHALRGLRDDILSMRMGSTHQTIYMPDVERIQVPLPPLDEQWRIADHLDAETAHIDTLITKRQRQIELLVERRQAKMFDAISGRDLEVARCGSELAWLDDIPQHWSVVQVRKVAMIGTGHTPSRSVAEYWLDCTIPWVTTGEVAQVRDDRQTTLTETREMISELGLANSAATLHPAGTVVLSRTASAGFSAVLGREMATSQDYVTWAPGEKLRAHFLLWCLRVMRPDLLGRLATGSTHKTIYMPDLEGLKIPLPPIKEQEALVAELAVSLASIDRMSDLLKRQIGLLRERRQAMITAAVTGELLVS